MNNWPNWHQEKEAEGRQWLRGQTPIPTQRCHEYASSIIEAHLFNRRIAVHASVRNTGLIPNLPLTDVLEVEVVVDKKGFTPTYNGPLPEQVAALCGSNMAVYELTVPGILHQDRKAVIHAMMLDPLTAAVCCPAKIREMATKLLHVEKAYIPAWCNKFAKPALVKKPKAKK